MINLGIALASSWFFPSASSLLRTSVVVEGNPEAVGPVEGLEYVVEEPLEPDAVAGAVVAEEPLEPDAVAGAVVVEEPLEPDAVAGAVGPPEPEVAGLEREEDDLFEVVGLP